MTSFRYTSVLFIILLLLNAADFAAAQSAHQDSDSEIAFGWADPFSNFDVPSVVTPSAALRGGAGTLDPTFGTDGLTDFLARRSTGLLFQPDGKILVAGRFGTLAAVFRFNPDGTPDTSFGSTATNFYATVELGSNLDTFFDIALQQDMKIVAAGGIVLPNSSGMGDGAAIVRFHPDGSIDESFGTEGLVFEPGTPESDTPDLFRDVHVRSDGRIIAGGHRGLRGFDADEDNGCYAVQYLLDGSRDPEFGTDGLVSVAPELDMSCENGLLMNDGRYVLGALIEPGPPVWAAVRLLADGTPDPTFGTEGLAQTTVRLNVPNGIAVGPDGSVTLAGSNVSLFTTLVRFTPEGELDPEFGTEGVAQIGAIGSSVATEASMQSDGKALVTGWNRSSEGLIAPYLARVLLDGTLDPTFGAVEGFTRFYEREGEDTGWGWTVSLDSEGRIVVAGEDPIGGGDRMGFVARFENDPAVAAEPGSTPERLTLSTPVPNPTAGHGTVTFTLAEPVPVRLALYDVLGREVIVLSRGFRSAGEYQRSFDVSNLNPGLYVVRLMAGETVATRRLTVVR